LVTVSVTPGITPAPESLTVPRIVAVGSCADAEEALASSTRITAIDFMVVPITTPPWRLPESQVLVVRDERGSMKRAGPHYFDRRAP
jgi:hypothetical protein